MPPAAVPHGLFPVIETNSIIKLNKSIIYIYPGENLIFIGVFEYFISLISRKICYYLIYCTKFHTKLQEVASYLLNLR